MILPAEGNADNEPEDILSVGICEKERERESEARCPMSHFQVDFNLLNIHTMKRFMYVRVRGREGGGGMQIESERDA